MLISIVIPVHNEAENIGDLLEEITRLPSVHSYYTIVVDDASSDGTPEILNRKKKEMPNLEIISHSEQCGQSAALVTGIKSAAGDVVATMDGDGQNDPEDIPKLLDALLRNKSCHMAVGYRKKRKDTAWRIFSSRVANTVRSFLLKDNTPDTSCGLKVFYRNAFISLPVFNHMHRFLPALIKMHGGEVISVEVNHRPRKHGKSNYGTLDRLWVGIIDLMGVYWLRLRTIKSLDKESSHNG